MITVVVGKEIEKIKGDFESYLNGLNMVGEISYSQYSELYDEGTKQIQKAYELGKSELEKENVELKIKKIPELERKIASIRGCHRVDLVKLKARTEQVARLKKENAELKAEWQEQVQKATDEGYARTLQTIQLTKAKDHIKKLLGCLQQDTNDPQTNYYVVQYMTEAEQFLNSEVEK